jgi:polysaccharide export outer membrane protein
MKHLFKTLLFIISLLLVSSTHAQNLLNQPDLRSVKVDQLTDDEIKEFALQASASGLSNDEIKRIALSKGLPASEVLKLEQRVGSLGTVSPAVAKFPTVIPRDSAILEPASVHEVITGDDAVDIYDSSEIFGHGIFRKNSIENYERAQDIKAPDNYVVGIGDEFTVSVFGFSYYNETLKVDVAGFINPSGIGPINVKGLTYGKARALIRSKFSSYFDLSNNQFTTALSYSRIITVNIVGEVSKAGSYKIPAANTVFNALLSAGGPGDLGSVRNIQVKREGKLIHTFDVYEFLLNPNSNEEYFLENNDYIFIPTSAKIIRIQGQVKHPMRYELKPKETLSDLLRYSGGLTGKAYTKLISVNRLSADGSQKLLLNISLDSLIKNKRTFDLQDGDEIFIAAKSEELQQYVEIDGAVNMPGKYELIDGERISDLVKKANGTRYETLLEKAFLVRLNPNLTREYISINLKTIMENPRSAEDLVLRKGDIIRVASSRDFSDELKVDAIGAFRRPNALTYSEGMTLADLLFLSGGLRMEADVLNIEISRISFFTEEYKPGESSRIIIKTLQIGKDIKIPDDQLSFQLRPFDQVFARIVPDFEYQQNLTVSGEVKYPGLYALESKDERLADLIKRTGGINRFAFPEGATLYRPSLPGGYIVMNLKDAMKNSKSKYNYVLKAGDVINVPRTIDFIAVRGDVGYLQVINQDQVNAPFVHGKRANYYINEFSNGFTSTSWRKKTYVVDNNAKVNRTRNFILFKIYPKVRKGSVVYVIAKPEKVKKTRPSDPIDWNRAIEHTTIKLTGLATLIILFQTIK